jgi:uncharacterized membrane protein
MTKRVRAKLDWWKKLLVIMLSAILAGFILEALLQFYEAEKSEKSQIISLQDVHVKNGDKTENLYVMKKNGEVKIDVSGRYINKFQYYYASEKSFQAEILVETKNLYGNWEIQKILDPCRSNLNNSFVNIKNNVKSITIQLPEGVTVGDFAVHNAKDSNGYRILYISVFVGVFLFLLLFKKEIGKRVELGFLIISMTIGMLFIALQPPQFTSWDEHIHFYHVFDFFDGKHVDWNQAEYYAYINPESMEKVAFTSKEEKALQIQYFNENTQDSGYSYDKSSFTVSRLGYLHMAIVVAAGKFIGLPFYVVYLLGKIANLMMYCILMFFAIKSIPIAKNLLAALALMPTPMVLATAYSYDVALIGFLSLGTAMLIREFYYPEKKISRIMLVCIPVLFLYGSCPKAIYIPLMLSAVFLPMKKFKNKKQYWIWKTVVIVACLLLMLTFLIPTAGNTMASDVRGGDTDVGQQLQMVLAHPWAYIQILFKNISKTFNSYVMGIESISTMAYEGVFEFYMLVTALILGVACTEPRKTMNGMTKKSMNIFKISTLPLVAGVMALIWTALYLAFTEVGEVVIQGVQGRYYIPLLLPLLMIFYTDKIYTKWKQENYSFVMFSMVLVIWHLILYSKFLIPYCS